MSALQPRLGNLPPPPDSHGKPSLGEGALGPAPRNGDHRGTWLMSAATQEQRRQAARPNPPSGNAAAGEPPLRFWTTDVNRHYLEAIAERESRGTPDHGYGARNGDALGRYQFLPRALVEAKWFEPGPDGGFVPTERAAAFGVQSLEDWWHNAPAQEEAMRDFSRRNEEQATEKGSGIVLGSSIKGGRDRSPSRLRELPPPSTGKARAGQGGISTSWRQAAGTAKALSSRKRTCESKRACGNSKPCPTRPIPAAFEIACELIQRTIDDSGVASRVSLHSATCYGHARQKLAGKRLRGHCVTDYARVGGGGPRGGNT